MRAGVGACVQPAGEQCAAGLGEAPAAAVLPLRAACRSTMLQLQLGLQEIKAVPHLQATTTSSGPCPGERRAAAGSRSPAAPWLPPSRRATTQAALRAGAAGCMLRGQEQF